jgi:ABC-type sugar transport system, permease component
MKKSYSTIINIVLSVMVCIIVAFPIYWMVNVSFKNEIDLFQSPYRLIPKVINFKGYITNFENGNIFVWIRNSVIVAVGSVILNIIIASLAAFGISRFKNRFNNVMIFTTVSSQMIAPALIVAPVYIMLNSLRLTNNYSGLTLINVGLALGFSIWILKGFFDNIPIELDEAAYIDGCSKLKTFYSIIIPLSTPVLVSVILITFFDIYNEYMFASTLISNANLWLGTSGIASNTSRVGNDWSVTFSQTALFCVIPILFYFIFQRYIVKGLTSGAVKG